MRLFIIVTPPSMAIGCSSAKQATRMRPRWSCCTDFRPAPICFGTWFRRWPTATT